MGRLSTSDITFFCLWKGQITILLPASGITDFMTAQLPGMLAEKTVTIICPIRTAQIKFRDISTDQPVS